MSHDNLDDSCSWFDGQELIHVWGRSSRKEPMHLSTCPFYHSTSHSYEIRTCRYLHTRFQHNHPKQLLWLLWPDGSWGLSLHLLLFVTLSAENLVRSVNPISVLGTWLRGTSHLHASPSCTYLVVFSSNHLLICASIAKHMQDDSPELAVGTE